MLDFCLFYKKTCDVYVISPNYSGLIDSTQSAYVKDTTFTGCRIPHFKWTLRTSPVYHCHMKGKTVFAAIPLDAMESGETYSLPLISKEKHEGKVLLGLRNGEEYVFFFAPEGMPLGGKGESISFDIDWSKVTFRTAEEVLIAPIAPSFRLPVHFEKGKDENKRFCLRYRLGEKEFALSHDDSDKLLNIDGKKALKRTYDFEIAVKDLDFNGNVHDEKVCSLICSLSTEMADFKFLGNY